MAGSRYVKDRGLSARMVFTMFLLGLVYVLFFGLLIAMGVGTLVVVVIAAALLFAQFFFSDRIALFGMHGRLVTEQEAPDLYQIVARLTTLANMPMPKIAISEIDLPNAFATGRSPKSSVVCVTRGLLRRLPPQELEAVLSHELSHVAHRDVAVMTIASFIGVLAGLLTRIMFWSELFSGGGFGGGYGGRGRGNSNMGGAGNIVAIEMAIMLVSAIVYAISFLLIRTLSRYRELAADRAGAILIGRPALLKSALLRISGTIGQIPTRDLRTAQAFNAFFFTPAINGAGASMGTLFSTHPSLERRIAQLDALERELGKAE